MCCSGHCAPVPFDCVSNTSSPPPPPVPQLNLLQGPWDGMMGSLFNLTATPLGVTLRARGRPLGGGEGRQQIN